MKIKLLALALSSLFVINISAQKNVKRSVAKKKLVQHKKAQAIKANHKVNSVQAVKFLKRTNKVILTAHKAVNAGGKYTGDLSKAIHHQRYAKKLLKMNKAHKAVQHSRIARKRAMVAIRYNKGVLDNELNITQEERKLVGDMTNDADLEKELKASQPELIFDDKSVSDKDMTELEVLEMDETDYKNE